LGEYHKKGKRYYNLRRVLIIKKRQNLIAVGASLQNATSFVRIFDSGTKRVERDHNLRRGRYHKIRQALLHFAIGALLQNAPSYSGCNDLFLPTLQLVAY